MKKNQQRDYQHGEKRSGETAMKHNQRSVINGVWRKHFFFCVPWRT